jgi:DNA-repair protein XRCC3
MCSGEKDRGKCSAGFISISELLKNSLPKLSFGCPFLDSTFGGGIYGDGITEICGESASGKTQLCLQLCLSAQCLAPRKGSGRPGAIFLATEDNFPSKRLEQLVRFSPVTKPYPNITPSDWTNNILVEHVAEFEQLLQTVRNKIPELLKTKEIRLLIIDSVAAIFRCYEKEQIKDRWRHLSLLGHALHDLSSQVDSRIGGCIVRMYIVRM